MAATVIIEELSDASTGVDKTLGTVRFKSGASTEVDSSNPLSIPSSGNVCSFTKVLRVKVTGAPTTEITNLQCYTGGSAFPSGFNVYYKTSTSFVTPGAVADSAARTSQGITNDFISKTVDSPIILGDGPYTGTGQIGDHLVLCLQIDSTATASSLPPKSVVIGYDET